MTDKTDFDLPEPFLLIDQSATYPLQHFIISASEKSFLEELEEAGDTMDPVGSDFQSFQSKPTDNLIREAGTR